MIFTKQNLMTTLISTYVLMPHSLRNFPLNLTLQILKFHQLQMRSSKQETRENYQSQQQMMLHYLTDIHCLLEAPVNGLLSDPFQAEIMLDCWEWEFYAIGDGVASNYKLKILLIGFWCDYIKCKFAVFYLELKRNYNQ